MPEKNRPLTDALLDWVDHRRRLLLAVIPLLYLAAFNGQWRPGPDSAEHLILAQRIIDGHGFTHPTGIHHQLYMGLAYSLAAIGRPFGHVQTFISHAALLAVALATLALAYAVFRRQYARPVAVLLTAMLALTETFFRLGYDLLTDMPFCFGVMLVLLGWAMADPASPASLHRAKPNPRTVAAGFALLALGVAIATLFRSVVITVLVGLAFTVLLRLARGPHRGRAAALGATALAAWCLARLPTPGMVSNDEGRVLQRLFDETPQTFRRMFNDNMPRLATENAAEALFAFDMGPILSVLLLVPIALAWWRLVRVNRLWGMVAAAFFLQWLLFMPGDRYFLPILLPLLAGWWETIRWVERGRSRGLRHGLAAAMLVLWIAPNAVLIGKFIVEQRRTPFLESLSKGRYTRLRDFGAQLHGVLEPDALTVGSDGPVLTWYSGRNVMDPKQLWAEVDDGTNRRSVVRLLLQYPKLYVILPYEEKYRAIMRRMTVDLGEPVLTVPRREGEEPWTVHPATIKPKMIDILRHEDAGLSVDADQLDDEHEAQPAGQRQ